MVDNDNKWLSDFTSNVPAYNSSKALSNEFAFDLFSCVSYKGGMNAPEDIDNTCMILGYKDGEYVVVKNSKLHGRSTSAHIEIIKVDKAYLEDSFDIVQRPHIGILKKCEEGDEILCVARGRYQGVNGGYTYEVKKIVYDGGDPSHRVHISKFDGSATYERKFFVVTSSKSNIALDKNNMTNKWPRVSTKRREVDPKIKFTPEKVEPLIAGQSIMTTNACGEVKIKAMGTVIQVVETEDIIERRVLGETTLKRREFYETDLIERQI